MYIYIYWTISIQMCCSVRIWKVCIATVLFSLTRNTVPGKSVSLLQDSLAPKHWGHKSRSIFFGSLWHLQISWWRLNMMMSSYQYNDSHYKCNTISRPSYLYNGQSLYWGMPRIHKRVGGISNARIGQRLIVFNWHLVKDWFSLTDITGIFVYEEPYQVYPPSCI